MFEKSIDYKLCSRCHRLMPKAEFHGHKGTRDLLSSHCKDCGKEATRVSYQKHKEKRQKEGRDYYNNLNPERKAEYKRNRAVLPHGISQDQYCVMLDSQDYGCALCGTLTPGGRSDKYFCIDHDHETGEIRGLLCNACNIALGWYENILERVSQKKIRRYLDNRAPRRVSDGKTPLGDED
jgi:hypothetical protein